MAAIIENQYISKRRRITSFKPNSRSAGFNSEFMSQFKQKPVHIKRKRSVSIFSRFSQLLNKRHKQENIGKIHNERPRRQSRSSGFSFPLFSLKTFFIIAGIAVFAYAALNWEGITEKTPDIYAFTPVEDENIEKRIIEYAATGIPNIISGINANIGNQDGNILAESQSDTPHGMLLTFEWQQYRVQRGDSVSGIAQKYGVSVGAIIASNEIQNARRLQEGAVLRIPNIDGIPYKIQRGDSLSRISVSFNVPLEIILDVNDIKSDNIRVGETIFIPGARMNDIDLRLSLGEMFMFPLQTRRNITSYYGWRKDPISGATQFHNGVDFRANTGTTVMAALDGTVSVVRETRLYGKHIIISHSNGYKTLYAHLNSFSVRQGDRVARGRKIGEVGSTGYSTGPHLHFGIIDRNGKFVNPLELIN